MLMLARVVDKVLGTCSHCLATVSVTKLASVEAFLAFESTGLCQGCQDLALA